MNPDNFKNKDQHGVLQCLKCRQKIEADSFEKADEKIDHGASSIKCSGSLDNMIWWAGAKLDGPQIIKPKIADTSSASASTKKKTGRK